MKPIKVWGSSSDPLSWRLLQWPQAERSNSILTNKVDYERLLLEMADFDLTMTPKTASSPTSSDHQVLKLTKLGYRDDLFYWENINESICESMWVVVLVISMLASSVSTSVTNKKSPNVYKKCPKMNSLEKWKFLKHLQKLYKNVGDLGKIIVALKSCPKCNKSPNLVTLVSTLQVQIPLLSSVFIVLDKRKRGRDGQAVRKLMKGSVMQELQFT